MFHPGVPFEVDWALDVYLFFLKLIIPQQICLFVVLVSGLKALFTEAFALYLCCVIPHRIPNASNTDQVDLDDVII